MCSMSIRANAGMISSIERLSHKSSTIVDPELHMILLGIMEELGYPVEGLLGLCEGFTTVGMIAFFDDQLEACNETINYINETLVYSDLRTVKKHLKTQNRHALMQGDKKLVAALELLDAIALHQTHLPHSRLFKATDFSMTQTREQTENEAGLFQSQLPTVSTYEDFITYFKQLLNSVQTSEIPITIKVEMGYASHSRTLLEAHVIGISYHPVRKNFALIDINQLPIKTDVVSLDELIQFISDSKKLLKQNLSSFRSFLYTTDQHKDSVSKISETTLSSLNAAISSDSMVGLSFVQKDALKTLAPEGLTAMHLRQWHSDDHFSSRHTEALTYLMRNRFLHPDKAIAELCDLNYIQAEAITRGMLRDEVIGLQSYQIITLEEFKKYGLTATHLRTWKGGSFGYSQNIALKRLLAEYHLSPDAAMVELNNMVFPL